MEKWKAIKGYEGLYEVSNRGNIKSLPKQYGKYVSKEKVMKLQWFNYKGGGLIISLTKEGKAKTHWVARLTGLHWVKNPFNLPQINHKDLNKRNNWKNNLEWVTSSQNIQHSWDNNLNRSTRGRPIEWVDKDGKVRMEFRSIQRATKYFLVHKRTIKNWINGKRIKGVKKRLIWAKNGE